MFNRVNSMALALLAGTKAFQAENHPFVGEHHDADTVPFEGGTSHRAEQVKVRHNKYDTLLDKTSRPMRKSGER